MDTLAKDLLLLLLDDERGIPLVSPALLDLPLAGALLVDLALAGRIGIADGTTGVEFGQVEVRSDEPVLDPILEEHLGRLRGVDPRPPQQVVLAWAPGLRTALLDELEVAGILRRERGRILGLFPRTTWPAASSEHEDRVRTGLEQVLVAGAEPTERQAALVGLLWTADAVAKAMPHTGHEARVHAAHIAQGRGDVLGADVVDILAATHAAVLAAVAAATIA